MVEYALKRELGCSFEEAESRVREALEREGFGVMTEIDVSGSLKDKLGVVVPRQLILGACNPSFAHRALSAEPDVGLLLPCNVVLRAVDDVVVVGAIRPATAMSFIDNDELGELAALVEQRLCSVVDSL